MLNHIAMNFYQILGRKAFQRSPAILHCIYYTEVGGATWSWVCNTSLTSLWILSISPSHSSIVVEPCAYVHLRFLLSGKTGDCFMDHVSAELYVSTIFLCSYKGWPSTLQLCSTSRFSSSLTKSSLWGTPGYMCIYVCSSFVSQAALRNWSYQITCTEWECVTCWYSKHKSCLEITNYLWHVLWKDYLLTYLCTLLL